MIKPLKRLHGDIRENIEDDTLTLKKVAPGPDTEVFEIQREELKKELVERRSRSVPNLGEKFKTAKITDAVGSKFENKMSEKIAK